MRLAASRSLMRVATAVSLVVTLTVGNLLIASGAEAQRIRPDFWGMHVHWATPPDVPVGSANLTTAGTYWWRVETSPGEYDFTRLSDAVAGAEAIGAKPMLVLGGTPWFHSTDEEGKGDRTDMPDMDAWQAYVRAVVTQFGDQLDYQIWPEPNNPSNWSDTPQAMAQVTVAASEIIRELAPSATVVAPSFVLRLKSQRNWAAEYFEQEVDGRRVDTYLDVVAINPFPVQAGSPEDAFALEQRFTRRLARIGVAKPVWDNEINYGVGDGGGVPTSTEYSVERQQAYVIRTYVLDAAARMERTYWLGWFGAGTMAVKMTDEDGRRLPPGDSFAVVRSWLNKTNFRGCKHEHRLWACTTRTSDEIRRVYWKRRGSTTVETPRATLRVEDQDGAVDSTRVAGKRINVDYRPVMVVTRR